MNQVTFASYQAFWKFKRANYLQGLRDGIILSSFLVGIVVVLWKLL